MKLDFNYLSDSELLHLLSKGKPHCDEAFKVIYKKYSSGVHAYCYKLIHDKDATEDIFQDTFISFFKNASAEKSNGTVRAFLFTIARNLCFNYLRDKKNTVEIEDFHLFEDIDEFERSDSNKYINVAIELLEIEYREPFVLRMYDGLSYNEIAEICNLTPEAARQRVFRAKEKMKNLLKPYYNIKSIS